MPAGHIRRTVRRMAMQIAEDFNSGEQVLLVGINTRGNHFARLLREALLHTGIAETGLINLNVHDMELAGAVGAGELSTASHILLIDDVLFSGSTMMQALRFVLDHATPKVIKMAVLVDPWPPDVSHTTRLCRNCITHKIQRTRPRIFSGGWNSRCRYAAGMSLQKPLLCLDCT